METLEIARVKEKIAERAEKRAIQVFKKAVTTVRFKKMSYPGEGKLKEKGGPARKIPKH